MPELLRLPIRFNKDGFIYWQICRTDHAAIYEQRMTDGRRVFYEVWKIRARPPYTIEGRSYPQSERGPGSEHWGTFGWTFYRLEDARRKYDFINGWGSVLDSFAETDLIDRPGVARIETAAGVPYVGTKSCSFPCGPGDYCPGGLCDQHGCYKP